MITRGDAENADDLIDALSQTSFTVMAVLARAGAEIDLSLTQLRVLAILRDRRLRMSALADHLGLERSTMSGLVDRAEKRGLMQRAPSEEDRRAIDVFLTDAGRAVADDTRLAVGSSLAPLTDRLSADARRALVLLLGELRGATPGPRQT
ncbi:MarR family transcriptional regulator [Glaciibacter flavus]|uniref:MarR family transcriptional regulator n=1 Tax=Orlajensenia flava TaxID=2565934 RepID=A0A4S4FWC9_9MICO|nr:MarR family transcriptional regulator [Glaciibacter flavus]THG35083.1 MarR family transcriptional regulator [Glaciibacter flavus]